MAIFAMTCEENLPFFEISGKCTIFEAIPETPTIIIRTNENWGVIFEWKTTGPLNFLIAGTWHLDVLLEKWGPGEAGALPTTNVPFVSAPHTYNRIVTFAPQPEGSYKISTRVKLHGPGGVPGPLVCMAEGPMLDFYVAAFP
jgi:hypothetical protein